MASTAAQQQAQSCHLFRLPLELRQEIYSYLIDQDVKFTPIPSVGITSVSPRPPSFSLLSIHPTITEDILDYFYSISTWKIVCTHSYNLFRVDPEYQNLARCRTLSRIRHVEIEFFSDGSILRDYPSAGIKGLYAEIQKRATRLCQALLNANDLRTVTVSCIDMTSAGRYTEKCDILEPLRMLGEHVRFEIGYIHTVKDDDKGEFVAALQRVVGNRLGDRTRMRKDE